MTFKPIFYYSTAGSPDTGPVQVPGEIQITYTEQSGTQVNYSGKHGTITLGEVSSTNIDKLATISGGYQSGSCAVPPEINHLSEVAQSYIREHLDEFKAKAFNAIPESSNAIGFKIMPPYYTQMKNIAIDISTPMGNGLGGSSGHVYIGDKNFDYDNKWTSISYIEDYLRNEYLPEHNLKSAFYGGVIIGRSDGGVAKVSGFVTRE